MAYGYFKPVAVGFIVHPADIIIIIDSLQWKAFEI